MVQQKPYNNFGEDLILPEIIDYIGLSLGTLGPNMISEAIRQTVKEKNY